MDQATPLRVVAGDPHSLAARGTLARAATAEALGTAFLVAAVVGSGIMGERLAAGNVAVALLAKRLPQVQRLSR